MKKGILIALDAILFLAGFPLLLILVYFQTKHGMDMGYGNGFFQGMGGWVPFLLASILFVVVLIVELVLRLSSKKTIPAGKSTFKKQALKLAAAGFCVLGGLMIVLDIALPELLFDATSNTLLYEDLVGNYDTQHDINNDLIMRFIELNVATGELNEMSEEEYKKLGLNDDKVSELIALKFDSIDSAFVRFNKIAIDMALKGVMTGDIIGLLIVPFSQPTEGYLVYFPMEGNVNMNPDVDGDGVITKEEQKVDWNILDMLGSVPDDLELPGGITLTTSNTERGVLDYQNMAWLDSVGLLGIITGLFSVRELFYIFSAVIAIASILRGFCIAGYMDFSKVKEEQSEAVPA